MYKFLIFKFINSKIVRFVDCQTLHKKISELYCQLLQQNYIVHDNTRIKYNMAFNSEVLKNKVDFKSGRLNDISGYHILLIQILRSYVKGSIPKEII